jgi:hypothetical protein
LITILIAITDDNPFLLFVVAPALPAIQRIDHDLRGAQRDPVVVTRHQFGQHRKRLIPQPIYSRLIRHIFRLLFQTKIPDNVDSGSRTLPGAKFRFGYPKGAARLSEQLFVLYVHSSTDVLVVKVEFAWNCTGNQFHCAGAALSLG